MTMGTQTRYSRDTWQKNQLRDNMNTPRYGKNACHLCDRGRIPDDLTFKVSKYKTCGDVHLELSLLRPDQATCEAGQDSYRELCCPRTFQMPQLPMPNKPFLSVAAGLVLFWLYTRRIRRRVQAAPEDDDNNEGGTDNGPKSTKYQKMKDDQSNGSGSRKKGKHPNRTRSKSRERGMPRNQSKDSSKGSGVKAKTPPMVIKTFKAKKKGIDNNSSSSNILQKQQRRIQQQYYKTRQEHVAQSEDGYYHLDDDTMYNDSTLAGQDTVAGESIDAVITQVV